MNLGPTSSLVEAGADAGAGAGAGAGAMAVAAVHVNPSHRIEKRKSKDLQIPKFSFPFGVV